MTFAQWSLFVTGVLLVLAIVSAGAAPLIRRVARKNDTDLDDLADIFDAVSISTVVVTAVAFVLGLFLSPVDDQGVILWLAFIFVFLGLVAILTTLWIMRQRRRAKAAPKQS